MVYDEQNFSVFKLEISFLCLAMINIGLTSVLTHHKFVNASNHVRFLCK